ncbi:dethiobiotin synthase [Corynebacterium diphtheriae]|uniref:dethiobiotin synthase n=1 Tax=Corynebacterium diphtheriae TaxID=1717 RepID=UPI000245B49E|nr:dethiobiotin synthase [Corynebacterium diphtheriae]AEX48697.1 dithiobiotin synthetase [Corynebacterium diphtheriae BH8]OIR65469.1 dethiobiotin synthase [Corynebacterium diphtheriae]OIR67860.1 dethiobiotin synthase [Corynebacterium diphtheriae]OIR70059.1 dethiobiotin synthase [Corynebacterium diphtheriae]OIR72215.1 dethiobiotin synthase [Corynebacterium diphtheriae]
MAIVVVTGTNTDVGKTIASAAVCQHYSRQGFRVVPVKPVQTGEPKGSGDAQTIEKLTGIVGKCFARFPEPLAPNLSAQRAGMQQLNLEEIVNKIRELDGPQTVVVVEGAGGLLVRLADSFTIADVAAQLDAPLIVVTNMALGSLNAAELTVEAAQRRGLKVLGLIGGSMPKNPDLATSLNVAEMEKVTGIPLWGSIAEGAGQLSKEAFCQLVEDLYLPTMWP